MTNCKNCGAPLNLRVERCEYCSTFYASPSPTAAIAESLAEDSRSTDAYVAALKSMQLIRARQLEMIKPTKTNWRAAFLQGAANAGAKFL